MPLQKLLSRHSAFLFILVFFLVTPRAHAAPTFSITGISDESILENTDYASPAPVTVGSVSGSVSYSLLNTVDPFSLYDIPMFSSMSPTDLLLYYLNDDSALFSVSSIDGIVTLSARDYENPDDKDTNNVYNVTLIATDSDGNRNAIAWHVTILDQPAVSFSLTGIADKSIYENTAYTSPTPGISGSTIGSVTYSLSGNDAGLFSVNSSTGVVQLATKDYEIPLDSNSDNVYEVTLIGTDGDDNTASLSWSVTILNLPSLTFTIDSVTDDTNENSAWTSPAPAISGSFRSPLQFSLSGDDAALFTLNGNGSVTLPAQNFETPNDANLDNVYEATLTAVDNDDNSASASIIVTVHDIPFDPDNDDDGDNVINMVEIAEKTDPHDPLSYRDSDGDGTPDAVDSDADNDLLLNIIDDNGHDPYADHDGDYVPDYLDADDRGDGNPANCEDYDTDDICDYGYKLDPIFDRDQDGKPNHADIDSDNDLIPDIVESSIDSDGDGLPDHLDIDSDNDSIPDIVESGTYGQDSNDNGIANRFDVLVTGGLDSNGDGIDDNVLPPDFDNDGTPDYLDTDSDNDHIPDALEGSSSHDSDNDGIDDVYDHDLTGGLDVNNDGINDSFPAPNTDGADNPDYLDTDSDNDGIGDAVESGSYGLDANGNGIDDRFDALMSVGTDSNGDGILEDRFPDTDNDGKPDFRDLDSDNDSLPDVLECGGTDNDENAISDLTTLVSLPLPDTDNDGLADCYDTDSNDDNIFDIEGTAYAAFDTNNDGMVDPTSDPDNDGIDNSIDNAPAQYGLIPLDTDHDGIPDNIDPDKDGDSISNAVETQADDDHDGIPNDLDDDSDGDGISDYEESGAPAKIGDSNSNGIDDSVDVLITGGIDLNGDGLDDQYLPVDSDGDGTADYLDEDSDNDGIMDVDEGASDPDSDGAGNYIDIDSDNDFIPDVIEGDIDTDNDTTPDYLDTDSDNDSIPDIDESGASNIDTDHDGIADRFDVSVTGGTDANNDGIDDNATARDSDNDLLPDYLDIDSDDDRVPDVLEAPASRDTDGDGLPDYLDIDSDNDGIGDQVESLSSGTDTNSNGIDDAFDAAISSGTDSNADGILDDVLPDTDNDGALDLRDLDSDNDTLTDVQESGGIDADGDGLSDVVILTAPPLPNADNDSLPDYRDTDSNNDNVYDIAETSLAVFDGNNDGMVDITNDSDADGIDDTVDTLPFQFGLLTVIPVLDDDHDNISNIEEGSIDTDGDGVINRLDRDSDNDGLSDWRESGTPAMIGDSNGNGLDDSIDVLITGGTDANNDGVDDRYAPVDTDKDGIPDYLDTDADNDGISDLEETGNITLSGNDSDGDGIDDVFDVDATGGVDADGDGIDDAVVLIVDTDHDGIPNYLDTDSDNDGFPDGIENDDTNHNRIPDRLEAERKIKGSSGSGSTNITLLVLLAFILFLRRRIFSIKHFLPALLFILVLPAHAEEEYVCRDYLQKPSGQAAFAPCFYVGLGLGMASMQPDTDASSWEIADDRDAALSVFTGYHFSRDWFVELMYARLGKATLDSKHVLITSQESIAYQSVAALAGYYLPLQDIFHTSIPVKFFLKAGIADLMYDASSTLVKMDNKQQTVPALGMGIEWPFHRDWMLRSEIDTFSSEVAYLNISVAWWFGGKTYHYEPAKPVSVEPPEKAATPETVVPEVASTSTSVSVPMPEVSVTWQEKPKAVPIDSDHDGVLDPLDECPDTPPRTKVDKKGCARYTGYIQSLYGAFNSTDLTYPSYTALDTVILLLKAYPDTRIEVQAHTDSRGTKEYNQWLSDKRAEVVKQYLVENGIAPSRIEAHGYGETRPLETNDTPEGRSRNRRIDFRVLGK